MAREGNGEGGKGFGNGDSGGGQQKGKWLRQRGWRAFNGGNNRDGAKDTAACITTGERGMMVVMDHGLCVYCVCLGGVC